ncbi:MAG: DotU family type IV/VI secretion system protein, partial [Burkholderiales bacterium]|nr:DotU family type IV/VI secretion system protein [Burkholderiales bacterium]
MAEDSKQAFDPDATVRQPVADGEASYDPDATVAQPLLPLSEADPEATVTGPLAAGGAAASEERPAFDPDATDRLPVFDPEATVQAPKPPKPVRGNPFAPKAPPETIQANLSALGGINPLVAMANPVLAAVPQIRRTLRHPDPAGLLQGLRDQLEGLEMSAVSAEIPDDTVSAAVYALCALLDESAASTPWGRQWTEQGLLQALRGESGGGEGFFALLERIEAAPEENADLLEFLYICLALGFEGRYRGSDEGRRALDQVRERVYATVSRRRPRPDALSERWRTPAAQAAMDAALATAARATAARAEAEAATQIAVAAEPPARFSLARLPRRAIWSAVAGIVGASIVLYMLSLRLLEDQTRDALATKPSPRVKSSAPAPAAGTPAASAAMPATGQAAPPAGSAATALANALKGQPVDVVDEGGGLKLSLRVDHQFRSGSDQPSAQLRAALRKLGPALDRVPGAIVVAGHADASPAGTHFASNRDLSLARAQAAASAMAPALKDPNRLSAEGRGDAEPVAP